MRWMITDSGLGGLSVCAGLEQALTEKGLGEGIELLYVNATPDDRIGYNSLKTQEERIQLFDRFLKAATARFTPDEIAIACNTLSVIYDETEYANRTGIDVKGIVGAGVSLINAHIKSDPDPKLIIFATETTTEAGTYPRLISATPAQVSAQECPELAHAISNDASGSAARQLLKDYVEQGLERFQGTPSHVFAFLGCTHYGYQADLFRELIEAHGSRCTILNPNDLLVDDLVSSVNPVMREGSKPLEVQFISRYPVPQAEIDSMENYLRDSAPLTLGALQAQIVEPDLFTDPV